MWEGGRPRLIIDFQAERAVPKQSAECKPCAKVRVTDTPGATRYIAFSSSLSYFSPCLSGPCLPFLFCRAVLCCAVLSWYCAVPVSAGNTGEEARQRQGKAKATPGAQPRRAGERRTGSQGKGWMDGMEWMRLTWKRVGSIKVCRNFTTRVSYLTLALTHAHTPHGSHHWQERAGPAGTGGTGPDQASKGGRNGEFWQVLGWAGLASRDNFGAMFQVPEDKAHLRRESNSRHVSESGPHAPGPMYLQGSRNVSEVPSGPCQCTSCRTAYMAVRPVLSCPGGGAPSEHGGDPLSPGAVLRCWRAHRSQLGTSPP